MRGQPKVWRPSRIGLCAAFLVAVASTGMLARQTLAQGPMAREDAISRLNTLAASMGSVGTYSDPRTGEVVVLLPPSAQGNSVSPTDSTSLTDDALGLGLPVRLERTSITRASINHIDSALRDLRASVPGPYTYAYFFDPELQKVVVQSDGPESAFAAIEAQGAGQVEYRRAVFQLQTRAEDSQPFKGGAGLTQGVNGPLYCTSGFAVKIRGLNYLMTAAHCFAQGTVNNYWSGNYEGYVSWRGNRTVVDAETIYGSNVTYGPYIYTSGAATKHVLSAADPVVGSPNYCVSGFVGGTSCGHVDVDNNATLCSDVCTPNLAAFRNTPDTQAGDSGAPWYLDGGNSVGIRALHIGISCDLFGGNCIYYATRWSVISSYFNGATILT